MTNKKTEKVVYEKIVYETCDGEIFDVDGAFKRHPAITPGKANIDLTVNVERHTGLYFELRLSDKAMASLVQILNAAPVNGDPLNVTVNLDMDTSASNRAHEQITRYLSEIGGNPTLSNIAAGYIYHVDSLNGLQVDAAGREYVVSRITTLTGSYRQKDITTPTVRETRFIVPTPESSVMFCAKGKEKLYEFVGEEYGGYRIVKVFNPEGDALYGGVILERIEGGDD